MDSALIIPAVSVIIPVYNAEKYLREAIDSIIAQTFDNWELILLNDGSTDNSLEIARGYNDQRIRILNSENNHGLVYQLNRGINAALGQYIARLDADDRALPMRLQMQFDYLETHPEIALLGAAAEVIGSGEIMKHSESRSDILIELLHRNAFIHSTVMFRKSVYLAISNGFSEAYKYAEDYYMWQLFANNSGVANLNEILIEYRLHDQQVSRVHSDKLAACANKVQIEYLSTALKIVLNESECLAHLALINNTKREFYPATVKKWVNYLKEKNRFFPIYSFNQYVDSRLKTYIRGYFLWDQHCRSPLQFINQIMVMFPHLSFREMISVLKHTIL